MKLNEIGDQVDIDESSIVQAYTYTECESKLIMYSDWLQLLNQYKRDTTTTLGQQPSEDKQLFSERKKDEKQTKLQLKLIEKTRSRVIKLQSLVQKQKVTIEQKHERQKAQQDKLDQKRQQQEEKAFAIKQEKDQTNRHKQVYNQDKALLNLTKYVSCMQSDTKEKWHSVNGSTLEIKEYIHAQKMGWIAMNWDDLVQGNLIGKAYDPKSCQYIPDEVYKRQFLQAVREMNIQDFPEGVRTITYSQAKYHYGRMISRSCLGCQGISRPIRHTILKGMGHDYDFVNAHPQIFYQQICNMGIECPHLARYINNREYLIQKEIDWNAKHNIIITRDHVKKSYLARLNGGVGDIVVDNGKRMLKIKAHKAFDEEITRLHNSLFEYLHTTNLEYEKNASIRKCKGQDSWNIQGSTVNHWLCDMENRCLWTMYNYVQQVGYHILVLCFDGMVIKEKLDEQQLCDIQEEIHKQHGLHLRIVEKEMNEGFDITDKQLDSISRQSSCFKCFDWKYFDETKVGGTDNEIATLLKPLFKDEFIITHDSDSKGLTFDFNALLYKEFSTRSLVSQVSNLINDAAKKAFMYHLGKLQSTLLRIKDAILTGASEEEIEDLKLEKDLIEMEFNVWKKRVDDQRGWGNFNKSNSVAKLLAQELYQPNNKLINQLNIKEHFHLPIRGCKCIDLRTGYTWTRTANDWFDYECNISYIPWDQIEPERKDNLLNYINTMFTDNYEIPRLHHEERSEYILFIQALFGYSLTLSTDVRMFYLITGGDEGSNGKSKWFGALERILGLNNRFVVMQRNTVIDNGKQQSHFNDALYSARNASIGFISEMETDTCLKADIIKSVTGNDTQSGELKHKSGQVSYSAHYKLFMAFNMTNMPRLNGEDNALWDRIHLILFPHRFDPKDKVENDIKVKCFYDNLDVFFSWLVEGCKNWFNNKNILINVPRIVKQETSQFRMNVDYVIRFITDDTELAPDEDIANTREWHAKKDHVYFRYQKYCDKNKVQAMGQNSFYKRMQELGYQEHRLDNVRVYIGFKLRYDYQKQSE